MGGGRKSVMKSSHTTAAAVSCLAIAVCNAGMMLSEVKVYSQNGSLDYFSSMSANHLILPLIMAYALLVYSLICVFREAKQN